jgi:ketosteroid isomerase-like protein
VLGCETTDTVVQVLGDTAVLTHRVRTTVATHEGEDVLHERETIVFARQDDGRWLGVHEHLSPAPGV